jgi:hypothetical protein
MNKIYPLMFTEKRLENIKQKDKEQFILVWWDDLYLDFLNSEKESFCFDILSIYKNQSVFSANELLKCNNVIIHLIDNIKDVCFGKCSIFKIKK